MSIPAVSVNLCVWRPHPDYFREAVQSILDQTLDDFELIIVEDPSEVDGRELIPDLLGDRRIRYIHNGVRTNLPSQRNQALRECKAPYVAIIDADDIAEPDRLAYQYEYLQAHPDVHVLGCWLKVIDAKGNLIGARRYPCNPDEIAAVIRRFNPIPQPGVMCRTNTLQALGGFRKPNYVEDYDLWCRAFNAGNLLANVGKCLLRYRLHVGAAKLRSLKAILRTTIEVKREHFAGQFTMQDRFRLWAEHVLLLLPSPLVYRTFLFLTYCKATT